MNLKNIFFQICEIFPENMRNIINNIEKKVFFILKSQLSCINVVTREEFENHQNFLIYTSKKIDEIENRMAFLEKNIKNNSITENNEVIKDK